MCLASALAGLGKCKKKRGRKITLVSGGERRNKLEGKVSEVHTLLLPVITAQVPAGGPAVASAASTRATFKSCSPNAEVGKPSPAPQQYLH